MILHIYKEDRLIERPFFRKKNLYRLLSNVIEIDCIDDFCGTQEEISKTNCDIVIVNLRVSEKEIQQAMFLEIVLSINDKLSYKTIMTTRPIKLLNENGVELNYIHPEDFVKTEDKI